MHAREQPRALKTYCWHTIRLIEDYGHTTILYHQSLNQSVLRTDEGDLSPHLAWPKAELGVLILSGALLFKFYQLLAGLRLEVNIWN